MEAVDWGGRRGRRCIDHVVHNDRICHEPERHVSAGCNGVEKVISDDNSPDVFCKMTRQGRVLVDTHEHQLSNIVIGETHA